MPEVTKDVGFYLNLYRQCSTWNKLPEAGGLFDQRWEIMDILNAISAEVSKWRDKKMSEEKEQMEKEEMLRGLNGRRK